MKRRFLNLVLGVTLGLAVPAAAMAQRGGERGHGYSGGGHGYSGGERGFGGGEHFRGPEPGYRGGGGYDRDRGHDRYDRDRDHDRYYGGYRGYGFGYAAPYYGYGYSYRPNACGYYDAWGRWIPNPGCYVAPYGPGY